jgi:hypothetical protein
VLLTTTAVLALTKGDAVGTTVGAVVGGIVAVAGGVALGVGVAGSTVALSTGIVPVA